VFLWWRLITLVCSNRRSFTIAFTLTIMLKITRHATHTDRHAITWRQQLNNNLPQCDVAQIKSIFQCAAVDLRRVQKRRYTLYLLSCWTYNLPQTLLTPWNNGTVRQFSTVICYLGIQLDSRLTTADHIATVCCKD